MSIDQLTKEVLSLSEEMRLQLIEDVLTSLETSVNQSVQAEWLAVAKQRRDEIRDGLVQPIAGEDALAQVRELLR